METTDYSKFMEAKAVIEYRSRAIRIVGVRRITNEPGTDP